MPERSPQMYQEYRAGARQFDYFLTGLSAAVFAYLGQHYVPHKLTGVVDVMDPAALIALLQSIYFGLRRIENGIEGDRFNFRALNSSEKMAKIHQARSTGGATILNTETGHYSKRESFDE